MKYAPVALLLLFVLTLVSGCGWIGRAGDVVGQQVDPGALLTKYEWFKDAASQLDKKQADIKVFQASQKDLVAGYKGKDRTEWAREDRDQYNLLSQQISGVKASYNQVSADYNSQMAKINWAFCNSGDLPKGADKPLPFAEDQYEAVLRLRYEEQVQKKAEEAEHQRNLKLLVEHLREHHADTKIVREACDLIDLEEANV